MIVTVEIPGGSLAQGDLILRIGTWATINAGGLTIGGTIVERVGRGLQPQVMVFRPRIAGGTDAASAGLKSESVE